jgi:phytanoyl-CoA hydroxylase
MLNEQELDRFDQDGFLVIENFISVDDCERLKNECMNIIDSSGFLNEVSSLPAFSTQSKDEYFLTSADKIRAFLEDGSNGDDPKLRFNKIGHALHALNPIFKEFTFSQKVKDVIRSLGLKRPVVCQSMYIFKQPRIGGKVVPHQDAMYLITEPDNIIGIWIALEDCTLENGCLSFIPGSHKNDVATRFIRNPNKDEFNKGKYLIYTKPTPEWNSNDFKPVPVKAGSAIVIHGKVVHQSEANKSSKSRNIYTFHIYESDNTSFSKDNWMEPSERTFLSLNDN